MIDKTKEEKLFRFVNDVVMREAVYNILLQSFLKPKDRTDVNTLAASRIAIDLLQDGWKELQKYKTIQDEEKKNTATFV